MVKQLPAQEVDDTRTRNVVGQKSDANNDYEGGDRRHGVDTKVTRKSFVDILGAMNAD